MSLQLPLGPESPNISFQAFGFPEGGVFFLTASANSDNCVKYCRDFRIKEEVHQDKKEKAKGRHLPSPCSSFLASCSAIYPHFGDAERVQGKPEEGSGLNCHFFSEVLSKNSPPDGCWFTTQLDIINTTPTLWSEWEPAGTGGGPDCHLGAVTHLSGTNSVPLSGEPHCCHPPPQRATQQP